MSVDLKNGKVCKTFFYKGRQIFIIHVETEKYKGYHFKIVNKCKKNECYSAPFIHEHECEQISMQMVRQGRV